jgi:hypothetical protein
MDNGDIYILTSPSGKSYIGQAVCYLPSGKNMDINLDGTNTYMRL